MKEIFEIKDKNTIEAILQGAEYGTLALCADNRPYSLPLNFAHKDEVIYFHGSQSGRKIDLLTANPKASFSIVAPYSVIPSYFSSKEMLACPATHFFCSVIIDGMIEFVAAYDEKVLAIELLMRKLQPEGGHKPLNEEAYRNIIDKTNVLKLTVETLSGKCKLGQQLNEERFEQIVKHLEQRNTPLDRETLKIMKGLK